MTFYEAMNEVLQTSRYDWLTGRRVDIRTLIWEWIDRLLDSIFSNWDFEFPTPQLGYDFGVLSFIFMLIGGVLLVVAVVVIFRVILRRRKKEYYDLSDIFEELSKKNYSVSDLIDLSDTALDRRLAIRYRYIAALLHLNEEHIIEIKPSATNAKILAQISETQPSLFPVFKDTADTFHRGWFGYKNVDDDSYHNFATAIKSILETGGDTNA